MNKERMTMISKLYKDASNINKEEINYIINNFLDVSKSDIDKRIKLNIVDNTTLKDSLERYLLKNKIDSNLFDIDKEIEECKSLIISNLNTLYNEIKENTSYELTRLNYEAEMYNNEVLKDVDRKFDNHYYIINAMCNTADLYIESKPNKEKFLNKWREEKVNI